MSLDHATRALLEQLAGTRARPLHEGTPEEARAAIAAYRAQAGPAPAMARVEDASVRAPDGYEIPIRVLVPPQGARSVIVYLHGGGWVLGTVDDSDLLGRKLAERTSSAVVVVGYRLAPEHPYPTAVEDCYSVLTWVDEHRAEIAGTADPPLVIAGDSAGGNLAAVMALRARDTNGPHLALQVLIYPVTDADFDRPSYTDPENQVLLTRDGMMWFWNHYMPDAAARTAPDAAPLRAASLAGLPPAVVLTAEHDVLRDEGEAYVKRLREADVAVEFRCHEGQTHGFFTLLMLPGSERGLEQVARGVEAAVIAHAESRPVNLVDADPAS